VLAVVSLVLLLTSGVIGTTWGLVLLNRARKMADHHRLIAEERTSVLRSRLYVADMNQAFKHWEQGEIDELLAILDKFESAAERETFEWRYLHGLARTRPRQLVFFGKHESNPYSAVFAPDGRTVASCGEDRCIRFWDATTGQEERVLRPRPETASEATSNHKEDENCVRYTPDGRHLASACEDGTVRLWDLTLGVWSELSPKHHGEVLGLAISRDGKLLAAAGVDRIVRVWTATGQVLVAELTGHEGIIQGLAFSPDGRSVVSADRSGLVILWDVEKRGQRAFARSGSEVCGVDYSPDGAFLATAESNGVIRLWDAKSGGELRELGRHFAKARNVQFSPDGKLLASCGDDGCVRIWHIDGTLAAHFRAHYGFIWSVAFSPDCTRLVTASSDLSAKVWDLNSLGPSTHWPATRNLPVSQVAFAPRSQRLAMSTSDGRILVGDAASRSSLESPVQLAWPHSTLVFSPDDRRIIFTLPDQSVQSWTPAERRVETIFPPHQGEPPGKWTPGSHAIHLGYSVDQPLTAVYWDGLLRTWEGGQVRERRFLSSAPTPLSRPILAWSSDHTRVAIYYPDAPGISRLDLRTGAPCPEIHSRQITSLALSPSGAILAVVHRDSSIKLIDWATGEEYRTLAGLRKPTNALLFSRDERTLIGASFDGAVRLWHVETGEELFTLSEKSGRHPNSMVLSSDGSLLAVAGDAHEDGSSVTIYDIGTADQANSPVTK
jgi:WD40 repeat protein